MGRLSLSNPPTLPLELYKSYIYYINESHDGEGFLDVDVTRQTIGLIEKGDYNPTLKLCIKISKALDKTLDDLFWEADEDE